LNSAHHRAFLLNRALAGIGIGVGEVGRAAEHRHLEAGVRNRCPDLVEIVRFQAREEAFVHLQAVGIELPGHFDPFEDRHRAGAGDVVKAALAADKKLIAGVNVFDLFEAESLGVGKKSMALEVTLQPTEKTLTDEEIDAVATRVIAAVGKATGGAIRT